MTMKLGMKSRSAYYQKFQKTATTLQNQWNWIINKKLLASLCYWEQNKHAWLKGDFSKKSVSSSFSILYLKI